MPRQFIRIFIAIAIGITLVAIARLNLAYLPPWIAMIAALITLAVPAVAMPVSTLISKVRQPSTRLRWIIAVVLLLLSVRYVLLSADWANRPLIPQMHDEFMYLLQARMLAHGRLWMPQHPLADFFDSFYIMVRPVYGSVYFPGTALLNVPGIWLNLYPWLTAAVLSGLGLMFLYLLVTQLMDGAMGLLAALLLVSLEQWRTIAVATLSHSAVITLVLACAWCLLNWSRRRRWGWIIAAGALAGWSAITRPLDAAILLIPMGIAALITINKTFGISRKEVLQLLAACAAASPFLTLQLVQNRGMTGHWLTTPIAAYDVQNFPGMGLSETDKTLPAQSPAALPQARDYYEKFFRPAYLRDAAHSFWWKWVCDRLPRAAAVALPTSWLYFFLPFGLLALNTPWRIAVALGAITAPLIYAFVPNYLAHYGLITAPAFILLILLGCQKIIQAFPTAQRLPAGFFIGLVVLAIASLPEVRGTHDHFLQSTTLGDVEVKLPDLEHKPAVVLFTYHRGNDVHEEPVYNLDAPWPDDCQVIRAQDRGADDHRIFQYYAEHQPNRFFYRYDRGSAQLTPLGWAKDLANAPTSP